MKVPKQKDNTRVAVEQLRVASYPLAGSKDLDPLMDLIGDASYVLLGEASHGTHEYYTWRTKISKRLIAEKGFSFIAVEGDWPDCYKLNRFIKSYSGSGNSAKDVLSGFKRWPTWMWANWEVVALAEWLHKHNKDLPLNKRVGFYGLDVYSLWESMDAISGYLKKEDPAMLTAVQKVLQCFEPYHSDGGQSYGIATSILPVSCEQEVVSLLAGIHNKLPQYNTDHETVFSTEQNALVAVHAEQYYRSMVRGGPESWNIRDRHMTETLERLMNYHGPKAKAIVWEHNTHIGDARATDMNYAGMVNVGQLVKEKFSSKGVVRVGFGSYEGSVIAGHEWGDEMQKMHVPQAPVGTWENLLHETGASDKLILSDALMNEAFFSRAIGHRAIGVVYHPEYERHGNYVPSVMPLRYEAFIYLDQTMAVHPLHIHPNGHLMPETYPWGD